MILVFREIVGGLCGYAIVSFAILKIFWLAFGAHFYLYIAPDLHDTPVYFDVLSMVLLVICGAMLLAGRFLALSSLIAFCLVSYEYQFHHHDQHSFWQVALIVWLLSSLALTTLAGVADAILKRVTSVSPVDERFDR